MKKKFMKIATCAVMLIATLSAMLLPSMAIEEQFSGFTYIDFRTAPADRLQIIESGAFAFDRMMLVPTGVDGRNFCIANPTTMVLDSGCYMVTLALSGSNLPEMRLLWRFGGYSDAAFVIKNDKIRLAWTDTVIGELSAGEVFYLTYIVDIWNFKLYYNGYSSADAEPTSYHTYDLMTTANVAELPQNRYLYLYVTPSADKQGTLFIEEMTLTELPHVLIDAFTGYAKGYDEGFINGEEYGWVNGLDEGYASGKADGLTEGQEQGYNDGFTAGKDEGIEEGYFHGTVDGYDNGYADGLAAGKEEGKEEGYQDGHADGYGEGYNSGYDDGHYEGALEGYGNGRMDGLAEGYQNGLTDGYDNGYNVGLGERQDYWYDQGHIAGYDKGLKEYYNELYEKGLENIDENQGTGVQGFLAGMWNGTQGFMQELLDGITFSGLSLRSIVTTVLALALAAFVIRLLKG